MNGSLNKVMLIGNLGMDPEIRYFEDGRSLGRMRIATTEFYRDREGNRQERTQWHTVVVRNRLAEICHQYLKKGNKIFVEGRIQYREYTDNQGQQRYVTEIVATHIDFLTPRSAQASSGQYQNTQPQTNPAGNSGTASAPQAAAPSTAPEKPAEPQAPSADNPEDDLPF